MDSMPRIALFVIPILLLACGDNLAGLSEPLTPDSGLAATPDASPTVPDAAPIVPDAAPGIELACTLEDILPLIQCVTDNCIESLSDGTIATCLAINCGILLLSMPPECTQCILAAVSDPASALDACVTDQGSGPPMF
ncbi:MAG: hypothetical protein JKY56_06685 [Kofleriaceae bacterium]|nr:hypothetical protein [Kofleriaceae bacterium]